MQHSLVCIGALWKREMVRFYRDRSRVIGGLVPPVIFWLFIGSGFSGSFRVGGEEGITYMEYFFPGILTLIFLFTSVFSTMTIIEERREGFLQSVLVAPVPRMAIVLGKVFGSTTLALLQGLPFLVIGWVSGVSFSMHNLPAALLMLTGVAFTFSALGFMIAWVLDSTQGFHAIMNMFLIPLWLLSGALFPANNLPVWLEWLVRVNPLTYAVAGLHRTLFHAPSLDATLPSMQQCVIVLGAYCTVIFFAAVVVANKGGKQ